MEDEGTVDSSGNEGDDQAGGVRAGDGIPIFDFIVRQKPVENMCGCKGADSAISRKDNHHDHTARHSDAAQTACTMSFAHSANMQTCTASLCRAVWSW